MEGRKPRKHGSPVGRGLEDDGVRNAMRFVAFSAENFVTQLADLHIQVTWGPASWSNFALAGKSDPGARFNTGWDVDGYGAPGPDAAFAGAFGTWMRNVITVPSAGRARLAGHDLAQERTGHPLHNTAAVAGTAHFR